MHDLLLCSNTDALHQRLSHAATSTTLLTIPQEGCPNCDKYLGSQAYSRDDETARECTSQVFEGLIHLARPSESWVARWQRLDKFEPGMYAVKVVGNLSNDIIATLEENGFKYIPRDGTEVEESRVEEEDREE